jgi:hypothetical protein
MSDRTVSGSLLVALAMTGLLVAAEVEEHRVPSQPTSQAELDQLLRERLEAARLLVEATRAAYETDTVTLEQLLSAHRELLNAELAVATTPMERVKAHVKALVAARGVEAKVKALHDAGARGGEAEKYARVKTARLTIEIDLNHEKMAGGAAASDQSLRKAQIAAPKNAPAPLKGIEAKLETSVLAGDVPGDTLATEAMLGTWINVDDMTHGLKRIEIAKDDDDWTIQAWGAGGGEIDQGKVALDLLADSAGAAEMKYGYASWDHKFKETHLTLRLEKRWLMTVEDFNIFKDNSGRSNYRTRSEFKRPK